MISCIIGLHGSGKTWFMVNKFLYPAWQAGENILSYNQLTFSDDQERVERFWQLSDLYTANNVLIGFPEIQKLLNAQAWRSLPPMFMDLLCQHRHSQINMVGDTQNLAFIDPNLRRHISELFICRSMIRFPVNEKFSPLLHWISVQKKIRVIDEKTDAVKFIKAGRAKWYFISKFWTKNLYNTYEKTNLSKYAIWATLEKGKWTVQIVNRQLIAGGQAKSR
jgi:hypothetical protein